MSYYQIHGISSKVSTVAYAPDELSCNPEIREGIENDIRLPFSMRLYDVTVKNKLIVGDLSDCFYDYQPNSMAWPVMSEKMKSIIAAHLTGLEHIEWKEVIIHGKAESKTYYIPYFKMKLDVLNISETVISPYGIIMIPCFDKEKVKGLSVFHCPGFDWRVPLTVYVNEKIKKDLIKSGIPELSFSRAQVM